MNFKNMGSSSDGTDGQPAAGPEQLPLARQPSVYSLTFDEFQSTLGGPGKDFGSMNMDEFLKNIWTAEESQAMATALGGAGGASGGGIDGGVAGMGLQRQGSLTLPRTLSQKTVDEVWRDFIRESGQGSSGSTGLHQQRQPTLGEMTLEEFLARAGVVREDVTQPGAPRPIGNSSNNSSNTNSNVFYGELNSNNYTGPALGFPQMDRSNGTVVTNTVPNSSGANLAMQATGTRPYAAPLPLGNTADLGNPQGMRGGGIMGIGDHGVNNGMMPGVVGVGGAGVTVAAVGSPVNQMSTDGLSKGNGNMSSLSPVPYMFSGGLRGRKCGGAVEKVVERRQRRMIKNRESAARSRARKQAYTMELEAEVAKLKEQNQELQKKQEEMMEMQKNKVLEIINQQHVPKKRCLRRTLTGPW
ncbi:bZIP transcription factor 46-like [Phoenix dactylifera]|uniref:BZIP transcription factor 46-like n=1 Tax=Phoenix dactylifera TaxID=42345 RepID=A0A8B8ZWP5_PHODC|nr:bZIP transcription factor 46-like [Phoenix dactylifera]XP_038978723.1 bZIP transcription factor 46-like [Phoenix dactylifera]XP_038978725.1 bZIP transcription factor 46-like [Phoenix dactylifera]XP_038978726.1 bZIP transcription factor 46-like [Phoenix dactylifera]